MSVIRSEVWDYFDKIKTDDNVRKATCKLCFDSYSYATTITNLKKHLHHKHRDVCPPAVLKQPKKRPTSFKLETLWEHFTVIDEDEKTARCNICDKKISFKTTTTNLKSHLFRIHPAVHKKYLQRKRLPRKYSVGTISDTSDDDDVEDLQESQKLNEIWNYFEQEGSRARCVVCREAIADTDYEHLKAHLFEHHPKLLLQLVQDQDERQETKSNPPSDGDDNDNTYTEVVYLEQDSAPEDSRTIDKPKTHNAYPQNRAKKRHRNSSSSDHPIIKLKNENKEESHEEETELEAFIKYIRCLLKKLTPDVFSKVQVDILKTIMDAQYSQKMTVTDNSAGNSILTDIASGSVANVIRVSEMAPESSSLLGNYTVTLAAKSDELESTRD